MLQKSVFLLFLPLLLLCSCPNREAATDKNTSDKNVNNIQPKGETMTVEITSPAFTNEQPIPVKHSGLAENLSPALNWTAGPESTQSYAIVCDDPDAPTSQPWVHWVIYNIPADVTSLPEAVPTTPTLSSGAAQGRNDAGRSGYTGPRPPSGTHRYYFKLYALDSKLDLAPGATKNELLKAMKGHILAEGVLMGTFAHR